MCRMVPMGTSGCATKLASQSTKIVVTKSDRLKTHLSPLQTVRADDSRPNQRQVSPYTPHYLAAVHKLVCEKRQRRPETGHSGFPSHCFRSLSPVSFPYSQELMYSSERNSRSHGRKAYARTSKVETLSAERDRSVLLRSPGWKSSPDDGVHVRPEQTGNLICWRSSSAVPDSPVKMLIKRNWVPLVGTQQGGDSHFLLRTRGQVSQRDRGAQFALSGEIGGRPSRRAPPMYGRGATGRQP
jgi:hypothetical protein